jgi:phosphoribosylformylglycinamidine synthase
VTAEQNAEPDREQAGELMMRQSQACSRTRLRLRRWRAGWRVEHALSQLGFGVQGVRQGKLIELDLDHQDRALAEAEVRAMCERLLANPVIETWSVSFEE